MTHTTVTAAEMKALEKAANDNGLLYIQMMENAGRAAFAQLRRRLPGPARLLVAAGRGNNGGDGFVMARVAAKQGWQVQVLLAEGEPKTPDAITNFGSLRDLPVEILHDAASAAPADAVVDALYGTGFHGTLRPAGRAACDLMNRQHQNGALLLAVDLPSGINADTGNMGRSSTRENKTRYQLAREELGLSREKASELLETIAPERIEKIESERSLPRPDEVLIMAEKYKTPSLCNYFCARQCPIGQQYVPEIRSSELSDIVLKMLASLNAMDRKKERLIEIAADGTISKDEIDDFVRIQKELERISVTVETLQLWVEKMLANGRIDTEAYNKESEAP